MPLKLSYFVPMASGSYDPVNYKISAMQNWNHAAHKYHSDWASKNRGPFKSTAELVRAAEIKPGNAVLDIACGTGAVSRAVSQELGSDGLLVGIDFSHGALSIAKSYASPGEFMQMDAEKIGMHAQFDKILCQYALMFFPNPDKVLRELRTLMKSTGMLAISVHGLADRVPYFSTMMAPVLRHIPDIMAPGTPTVHRFGNPAILEKTICAAGFSNVSIKTFVYQYEVAGFEEYWSDYLSTTAVSIRARIESDPEKMQAIRSEAQERSRAFMKKDGVFSFPWEVHIATAMPR